MSRLVRSKHDTWRGILYDSVRLARRGTLGVWTSDAGGGDLIAVEYVAVSNQERSKVDFQGAAAAFRVAEHPRSSKKK